MNWLEVVLLAAWIVLVGSGIVMLFVLWRQIRDLDRLIERQRHLDRKRLPPANVVWLDDVQPEAPRPPGRCINEGDMG